MPSPGWVEIRATTHWNGERVSAFDAVPAEAWEEKNLREQVKQHLRYAIAQAITERMSIAYEIRHNDVRNSIED